ncbi:hypothetical protein [uncultured Nocardioides sp.]|uniref:hypothetical protein n=1 Tax=uncultured Nocardioides sp. TaxID=198441 RepID=UPI00262BB7B1|nr:hypothetical protein [uncultured Nocardioides sp.]
MALSPGLDWAMNLASHFDGPVGDVLAALRDSEPAAVAGREDPASLVWPMSEAVASAMYWQEPDERDALIADRPELVEALVPVAEAVLAAPATAWWSSGVDLASLQDIEFRAEHGTRHQPLTGVPGRLVAGEARERSLAAMNGPARPTDPRGTPSSGWWSVPMAAGLPATTRGLPGLGAVGLMWAEDGDSDYEEADLRRLAPRREPRVYEVDSPAAWVALVERFPLDVTDLRRNDWYSVSGRDCPWFLPEWLAVAEAYDAVHLTVTGYLVSATKAWDVAVPGTEDAATLLGGWNPDETLWLTDVLEVTGELERWRDVDDRPDTDPLGPETGWRRAG